MLRRALEALLVGGALAAGLWVAGELQSPYSDLRLWLSDQLEQVRGGTS
jgi:hypothetical protein